MRLKCMILLFLMLCPLGYVLAQMRRDNDQPRMTVPQQWNDVVRHPIIAVRGDSSFVVGAEPMFEQMLPVDDHWWRVFGDEQLDSLIAVACTQNNSVITAINRMMEARSNFRIERSALFPSIALGGGWTRQKSSGNATAQPEAYVGYWNAAATMNWEIDVFGSIRKRVKAQKQNFLASREEYNATLVSLCAQIAISYFTLREYQQELKVLNNNAASQKVIVEITEVRFRTGLNSKLDVAQARSVYYATLASIPSVQAGIAQEINTLAVLLGVFPSQVQAALRTPKPLPDYVEPITVGFPADLLRRRPDIRAAERTVKAQSALVGASIADWLPQFTLSGTFGYAAHELKHLTERKSMTWEIAPTVSWSLFNGLKTQEATRLARTQLNEAVNQYNQTVLTGVQEVETAMAAYSNSIRQIVALREALYQDRETLKLSLELYKQGLSTFQSVLDAERTLLSVENSVVQAQGNSLICLVQLYQALGGGWQM